MHEKKESTIQRVIRFAEEKGFYIILGLCIVAIGVSGYVLFFTGGDEMTPVADPITLEEPNFGQVTAPAATAPAEKEVMQLDPQTEPEIEIKDDFKPSVNSAPTTPREPESQQPQDVSASPPAEGTLVSNAVNVPLTFIMPVDGEIVKGFSMTEPVYNETMGDWRVHDGIDIACDEGTPVVAMTAGIVTGIDSDNMNGNYVSVTHSDGLVSTYFGLNANTTLTLNQEVGAGQEIGTVGNTMLAEIAQPCHLHFVVTKNGNFIDPLSLIK